MKIAISGFFDGIPRSPDNHYRGWIEILKDHVKGADEIEVLTGPAAHTRWNEFDLIYIHFGLYYYGSDYTLNLFGGMNDDNADRISNAFEFFLDHHERIRSLEYIWPPNLTECIRSRLSKDKLSDIVLGRLVNLLDQVDRLQLPGCIEYNPRRFSILVMGDSHSGSAVGPGCYVYRNDRETLYGAIRRGFKEKISRFGTYKPTSGVFHYGNIDIRHHLCRQPDPISSTKDLVKGYLYQIDSLGLEDVKIVLPYYIENPSRKMSKSVYFKGEPFFGSWKERDDIRKIFWDLVSSECSKRTGYNVLEWYDGFTNHLGELKFDVMERPKSIHLSPRHYRIPMFCDQKPVDEMSGFFS